jgi:leader peptidase (prepilin peptidase)/N-methyltransferase
MSESSAATILPAGLALVGALGLLIGSFLNVVIHRVPRGESILRPRSRCPACKHAIGAIENVPVLSWLALRGRCRHCRTPISARYPLIELTTGAIFLAIAWQHGPTLVTLVWCVFGAGLVAAAGIDFDERWIPDSISLGGLALGLVAMPLARWSTGVAYPDALASSLAGAALGGGFLWSVGFAHARVSVALGRTFEHWPGEGEALPRPSSLDYWTWFPGLGFGDVKLMAAVGAFLGPVGVLHAIVIAAIIGLGFGLVPLALRHRGFEPFGFGPAISIAAVLATIGERFL